MTRWGALSLVAHAAVWLALLFLPRLVGRTIKPPPDPATIEVVIGEGGQTQRQIHDDAAPPAADAPPTPPSPPPSPPPAPPPEPPPDPPDDAGPPPPPFVLPPVPTVADSPPLAVPSPPSPPSSSPPSSSPTPRSPATVRLADIGRPPHADLLDPENNRFRAATRDTGNRMPAYPPEAALRLESGTVKLQLFIDRTGKVASALITRSSGSASLDRAARDQALTWRFTPARRDGKPVPDIAEIEIEFRLI